MRLRPPAFALLALSVLLAGILSGCVSSGPGWSGGATGDPVYAQFSLQGDRLVWTGQGDAALAAGATLTLEVARGLGGGNRLFLQPEAGDDAPIYLFEGARLDVQTVRGGSLPVSEVVTRETDVQVGLRRSSSFNPHITFPDGFDNASTSLFHGTLHTVTGAEWQISGHDAGWRIADGIATPLGDSATVTFGSLIWDSDSRIRAPAVDIRADRFGLAVENASGDLVIEDGDTITAPLGVFGEDAQVRFTPTTTSAPRFRLTQVLTTTGLLLEGDVQVRAESNRVQVEEGGVSWLRVDYRERSHRGAAVADGHTVVGSGADMVTVPFDHPPLYIEQLWSHVEEFPLLAQPFAALAFVLISPAVILLDAFEGIVCAFSECPEKHPYPAWIDPEDEGRFYIRVDGSAPVGTYPATVRITGNHPPVTLSFDIEVVPPSA